MRYRAKSHNYDKLISWISLPLDTRATSMYFWKNILTGKNIYTAYFGLYNVLHWIIGPCIMSYNKCSLSQCILSVVIIVTAHILKETATSSQKLS